MPRDAGEGTLGRIGFPPGETGLLAVLHAYFDECGTDGRSRLVTVVGILATPKRWRLLSGEWWRVLHESGVQGEYKAAHCVLGDEQYATWPEYRRRRLRLQLGKLIDEHAVYAVTVSMLRDEFEAAIFHYARKGHLWRDPYPWALRSCLEFIAKASARGNQRVACVVDEGHGAQKRFFSEFPSLKRTKGWDRVFISLTSAPSHRYAPLQAADWLVYECHHHTDRGVYGIQKRYEGMLNRFRKIEIDGGYYMREKLAAFMRGIEEHIARESREFWEEWLEVVREEGPGAIDVSRGAATAGSGSV
jgi:hypothetical protein